MRNNSDVAVSHKFGLKLLELLGIDPAGVISFEVLVKPQDVVRVRVERELPDPPESRVVSFQSWREEWVYAATVTASKMVQDLAPETSADDLLAAGRKMVGGDVSDMLEDE